MGAIANYTENYMVVYEQNGAFGDEVHLIGVVPLKIDMLMRLDGLELKKRDNAGLKGVALLDQEQYLVCRSIVHRLPNLVTQSLAYRLLQR
jgi:hypothetical protein